MAINSTHQCWHSPRTVRGHVLLTIITFLCGSISISTLQAQQGRSNAPGLNKDDAPKEKAKNERPPTKKPLDRKRADYQVTEAGPHHRRVQRVVTEFNKAGEEVERIASYTALGIGLNYFDETAEEWVPAEAIIEPFENGAVAQKGQQKVVFARDISEQGSVDILNADGVRLQATVLGLAYFDTITGDDAIIASVQPSIGIVVPPNQIIYRDAFDNIEADVLYTYRISGVEQDVILREQPPEPKSFGLPNVSARLEVMTEFFDSPEPEKQRRLLIERVADPDIRAQMVEPDLADEELDFGMMKMPMGRAFSIGIEEVDRREGDARTPVAKKWQEIDGRTILFESVEYEPALPAIQKLPKPAGRRASIDQGRKNQGQMASGSRSLPNIAFAANIQERKPIEVAQLSNDEQKGYAIDYITLSGSLSNYTFEAGETYYISSTVTVSSSTTFEGGCVVKYAPSTQLTVQNALHSKTSAGAPAVLTVKDDNSIGETIAGSTGNPQSELSRAIMSQYIGYHSPKTVNHFDMRYVRGPLTSWGSGLIVRNSRFYKCNTALEKVSGSLAAYNVLIDECSTAFVASYGGITAQNCTVHDAYTLYVPGYQAPLLYLSNSLIVDVDTVPTSYGSNSNNNVELDSWADAFQQVGSGSFYLKDGSPYRNAGTTTAIWIPLLDDLASKTTMPPVEIGSQTFTSDVNWSPQVLRDDDTPDIGYHYPAIDYLVEDIVLENDAKLTVEPGVVVAFEGVGVTLDDNAEVEIKGQPMRRSAFQSKLGLQEDINSITAPESALVIVSDTASVTADYTDFSTFDDSSVSFGSDSTEVWGDVSLRFCGFYGGAFSVKGLQGSALTSIDLFGNLFEDIPFTLETPFASVALQQNNFSRASLSLDYGVNPAPGSGNPILSDWEIEENFVSDSSLSTVTPTGANVVALRNGYMGSSSSLRFTSSETNSVDHSSNPSFWTSVMGRYYVPSAGNMGNFGVNGGSQNADTLGLYHFTTQIAQTEGNSVVNIGMHYPAVGSYGELLDTDGDGIANLFEDTDGDGFVDSTETDWQSSENGTTGVAGLQIFTRLE